MKPLYAYPLVLLTCSLACGCGKVEPKKTASDAQPPKNAASIEPSTPAASAAAPSASSDTVAAEPKKPPAEDDPFPNGEPP